MINEGNYVTISLRKRFYLILITVFLLLTAVPVHAHNLPLGGSRWCLQKNGIVATIDLNQTLLSEINEVKEGHYDLAASSDKQLQQIATDIIQPYISKKLSITVNGKTYPVKVDKLVRNENSTFTVWLSVDKISFNRPDNSLKIDYKLLFEETNNSHLNMAYLYKSDSTGAALQKVFDFSPPAGQYNFASDSPVWEISVKGTVTEPATAPAIAANPSIGNSSLNQDRENAATQRVVSVLPAYCKRALIPVKGDVVTQTKVSQNSSSVIYETSQDKQNPDNKGAVSSNYQMGKQVSEGMEKGNTRSTWSNIGNFIILGIEHILTGYDHIAFLIGLIVIGLSFSEVLKIITAFTIAHSITLLLAALQIVSLNSRFVESVIALSICYIALENLLRKKVKYRWLITFCFGLVHGFGFASALQELIVGKSNLIVSVLSFNFGVETGQLMIFFILLPVMYLLKQKMEFRKVTVGASMAIFIFGFTWLIERLFDLKLISS
jgi:hydrogenase/urease accessory protein HupE